MAMTSKEFLDMMDTFDRYDYFRRQTIGKTAQEIVGIFGSGQLAGLLSELRRYSEFGVFFDDEKYLHEFIVCRIGPCSLAQVGTFRENLGRLEESVKIAESDDMN